MEIYTDIFNPSFLKKKEKQPQFPTDYSLAMAYIPLQERLDIYKEDEGFERGTIFPELDKPFCGRMVKDI